jgi:iron complex transport system substrate-binding protein
MTALRIVSLLPSLTELVCSLGRRDELVGVTHECDFPPGVEKLPHLTRSRIPTAATSSEIDALVSDHEGSLYQLDEALLAGLLPDLILTQEQCDVCAVNELTVRRAAAALAGCPHVESVNPTDLGEIFGMFRRVAALVGEPERGEMIVSRFETTIREIALRQERPIASGSDSGSCRVLLLEWLDPPFSSGHWNPELIERAGGREVLGRAGERSRRVTWDAVASSHPELIIVAPCGFSFDRTVAELIALDGRPEWRDLAAVQSGRVAVVDGSAYFSRPGPRLDDSLRIAAAAIDPGRCLDLAPPQGRDWRFWTTPA